MSPTEKFLQMFLALGSFVIFFAVVLFIISRVKGRANNPLTVAAFVGPTVLLLAVGLIYPAILTIKQSFQNADSTAFVGLYELRHAVQRAASTGSSWRTPSSGSSWCRSRPTLIGLVYAVLVDRTRTESLSKALVFIPMAISMVGASIIWSFVYDYRPARFEQIGLANQLLKSLGLETYQFLLHAPWNTLFLIVVMIWIQAGFAMTVLSASIKAIPDDIIEAAKLDGVSGLQMFRFITLPSIRPGLIVVLTTIAIGTLKVFDIVRTMTGGNFDTSVVANEFYTQAFRADNQGLGSALAVLLFILVIPIVAYNIVQLRKAES